MKHNNDIQDGNQQIPSTVDVADDKQVTTADPSFTGDSRRRFLQGALAAAPVLMTVTSRPAWGHVCAPSGVVSGNLSSPGDTALTCSNGWSPDAYNSSFPTAYDSYYFDTIFGVGPHTKIKNIIKPQNTDAFQRAAVAAYLNAELGRTRDNLGNVYLTSAEVVQMVHDVLVGGFYSIESLGVTWNKAAVQYYFELTWTPGALP